MSTYREVMSVAKDFSDVTKIADRRAAGKKLMDLLSKQEVRQRLAAEAGAASSSNNNSNTNDGGGAGSGSPQPTEAARQYALTIMWRNIVRYATLGTAGISGSGKSTSKTPKWKQDDISVFYNIIMYCDESSPARAAAAAAANDDESNSMSIFRLSRREVRNVIVLCIRLLSDDDALAVAEAMLLNMLAYIAGSKGYVANLVKEGEIKMIMVEAEKRIKGEDEMKRTLAARIFQNLCQTAESLGIQLHTLMFSSVKLVAEWCTESYRETIATTTAAAAAGGRRHQHGAAAGAGPVLDVGRRPVAEMVPLLCGLAAMVRSCPEQAIAPMTRHGRAILKFAKARYRQEPDPTAINVLNEFFLCHLLVCQVAGLFAGLMPGDLGDLGDACIKPKLLRDLLEIITTKNPTRAFASKKSDDDLFQWPLDKIEQTQLELTARLLACSQRLFLIDAERSNQMDNNNNNPERTLMAMIDALPNRDDFLPLDQGEEAAGHLQPNVASTSTFVKLILQPLHDFAPRKSLDATTPMVHQGGGAAMSQYTASVSQYGSSLSQHHGVAPSQRYAQSQVACLSQREQTQDQSLSDISLPLLENMAANVAERKTDTNTVKRLLQILAACAEIFPAGACWTSQSQSCWRDLPCHGDDDDLNVEVRHALACTPDDLAAIITTVANILEAHGDVSGDASVQQWALRCLHRLTDATSSLSLLDKKSSLDSIKSAWRRVWTILFRSDFRYMVYTRACKPESNGDLVLRLLSLMVRHFCVDPEVRWSNDIHKKQATFLYQRQSDLWNLPSFVHLHEPSVVSKFDLIISLLFSVGLAEGADSISLGLQSDGFDKIQLPNRGRRYRLVNVCLHCLALGEKPEMTGVAATCAAALSHGDHSPWSMALSPVTSESSMTRTRQKVRKTDVACVMNLFVSLWCTRQATWFEEAGQGGVVGIDPTCVSLSKLTLGIKAADKKMNSADILAKSQIIALVDDLSPRLDKAIKFPNDGLDDGVDSETLNIPLSLLQMKTRLTVTASCGHDQVAVELESVAEQLAFLLETVSSNLEGLSQLLGATLSEILKIVTFLVQVTSFPRVDLPSSISHGASLLCEKLENALEAYTGVEAPELPSLKKKEMKVDLEADSDDSESDGSSKRTRRPHRREGKRRRTEVPSPDLLDPKTALLVANLILLLKPSVSSAKFVAETVLGIDLDRHAQAPDAVGAFDLIAGATISRLFKTFSALHEKESRDSVASLIPMLIKMVRSNAGPESDLHLFGFGLCADVVVQCESIRDPELSKTEAADLLSIWKDLTDVELKSQSLRPVVRATSLRTTAMAFVRGKEGLRAKWEQGYPSTILAGVRDVSQAVRRQASVAVAASLGIFSSQEKIIESLFRNLPPISTEHGEYKRWYKSMKRDDVPWIQMWEDAKTSVEAGVLYCWASIGGRTTISREQKRILFRLFQIAHCRPDLEAACFQALDYMAHMAGFSKAESMVSECVNELSKMWRDEKCEDSFLDLPLLLTAPKAVRFLIRSGLFDTWTGTTAMAGLRTYAAAQFVRKNSHKLLPLHLAAPKQPLADDIHLRDFCSVHSDDEEFSDAILGTLVKKYLHGIIAYCASLQCGSSADQETAIAIHRRAEALLSEGEVNRIGTRRASIVVRGILENLGSTDIAMEKFDDIVGRFSQEVEDAANKFGTIGKCDPLSRTGCSLAECLLYATSWLRKSMAEWTRQQRFQVIALLTNMALTCIRRGDHGKMQLGFFVHVFSALLSDRNLSSIHSRTLSMLYEILKELLPRCMSALPSNVVTEIKTELGALLSSLMNLHELSQQHMIMVVEEVRATRERWRSLTMGVLTTESSDEGDDIWRSDEKGSTAEGVASFETTFNDILKRPGIQDVVSVLTGTYELIQLIVEKADAMSLEVQYFLGASPPYETPEADRVRLSEIDKRYCAQQLIQDFLPVPSGAAAEPVLLRQVLDQAGRIESTSYQCVLLGTKESFFSPHQKQFLAELTQLYEFLYSLGEAGRTELTGSDVNSLMHYLSEFCGNYPPAIRVQASRCIGELGKIRTTGGGFESSICRDWIGDSISTGDLERALRARCIEVLTACLKMQPISTAMVAMETLKALLCSSEGAECRDMIDNKGTLTLLEPFYSSPQDKHRQAALRLSKSESKAINRAFPTSGDTWMDWCWDEIFWASAAHADFEQWVCTLVPALLLCYQRNESNARDTVDFFACSQRMSCLQPRFSIALFPLIVLKLLRENPIQRGHQELESAVFSDAWIGQPTDKINDRLSRCFTALLKGSSQIESPDTRAIGLCVDTLDILRRFTLHRFINSSAHKRDRSTARSTYPYPREGEKPDYKAKLDAPVAWRGVPFGVGIRMDGILLAKACVRAKRFCSALLYAEMYTDAKFGGSTRDLERLAGSNEANGDVSPSASGDISGFGGGIEDDGDDHHRLEDGVVLLGTLRDCYSSMADDQQREAIERQLSDLHIAKGHNSLMIDDHTLQSSIRSLVRLDMQSSQRGPNQTGPEVVDWMQTVGVRAALRTYISGLTTAHNGCQNEGVGDDLRDRWFESCVMDPTLFISNGNSFDQLTAASLATGPSSLPASAKPRFNENVFMGLLALARNDYPFCKLRVDSARHSILDQMSRISTQEVSVFSSAETLDRLRALNDLERIASSPGQINDLIRHWMLDGTETGNYQAVAWGHHTPSDSLAPQYISESVREIALRTIFGQRSVTRDVRKGLDAISQLLWRRTSTSIHIGRLDDAESSLNRLYEVYMVVTCGESDVLKLRQLEATILERGGDFSAAIRRSTQIIGRLQGAVKDDGLLADTLACCGRWMTKHRVDSGNVILAEFLRPGLSLARDVFDKVGTDEARNRLVHSNLALGDLAFKLLRLVSARIKSPEWKESQLSLIDREKELGHLEKLMKTQKAGTPEAYDTSIQKSQLLKELQNTKASRERIQSSVNEYFCLSLQTVAEALCSADGGVQNMSKFVYRMVALWFAGNEHGVKSDEVDRIITDAVERIPTYRVVPLAHQLLARLDSTNNSLVRLATRLAVDHPYHIIVHLVRFGGRDATTKEPKARAAREILATVKAESTTFLAPLVENYELLTEAYNCLADVKFKGKSRPTKKMSFHEVCKQPSLRLDSCIGKGSRRNPCPPCILTKTPVLRPGCDYGDGILDPVGSERIVGFEGTFVIAPSGVSRPRIVFCQGSQGNKYKQLVKGDDDCRGDAVMMQVFSYVNELMMMRGSARGKVGKRAPLRVVTYSVIPLSPRNGVLEWVENTLPLIDFVTRAGVHSRYFPGEWSHRDCIQFYEHAPSDKKREVFDAICRRYSPVFRFFFVERFGNSAEAWYRAKMKYIQSVAVSSFVGHVLGIGDRHCSNILVHQRTGEVVHIDFGVVFEQGKLLSAPELVPFRLTRNIVDGFGPGGTEGAFTSVAEETLTTLKDNADSLLTILSAVTSDPLYKWRISPEMARLKQRDSEEDRSVVVGSIEDKSGSPDNETAAAAIQKVKEKLSGYEDGTSGEQQSTRGQVQYLISAARDHDNLCNLFVGWAPWL